MAVAPVAVIEIDEQGEIERAQDVLDDARAIESSGGTAIVVEAAPGETVIAATGHPKIARAWQAAWPFARLAMYGAAFAGGALVLGRLFGPRTARDLGERGGEGFAEGVITAQRRFAALAPRVAGELAPPPDFARARGSRWG